MEMLFEFIIIRSFLTLMSLIGSYTIWKKLVKHHSSLAIFCLGAIGFHLELLALYNVWTEEMKVAVISAFVATISPIALYIIATCGVMSLLYMLTIAIMRNLTFSITISGFLVAISAMAYSYVTIKHWDKERNNEHLIDS